MSSCGGRSASTLRVADVSRREPGAGLGFHLTRTKWDPYPWISSVDASSPAADAGLVAGDCLLEVNGEDVVGRRVSEIAGVVAENDAVRLLVWNAADADAGCEPEVRTSEVVSLLLLLLLQTEAVVVLDSGNRLCVELQDVSNAFFGKTARKFASCRVDLGLLVNRTNAAKQSTKRARIRR